MSSRIPPRADRHLMEHADSRPVRSCEYCGLPASFGFVVVPEPTERSTYSETWRELCQRLPLSLPARALRVHARMSAQRRRSAEARALRLAARHWADGATKPPIDARDSAALKAWARLSLAALRYAKAGK